MKSKEYLAVFNYFRNTQQLSKEELKTIVKEVVGEIAAKELRTFFQTYEFRKVISSVLNGTSFKHSTGNPTTGIEFEARIALQEVVKEEINKLFTIKIEKKEEQTKKEWTLIPVSGFDVYEGIICCSVRCPFMRECANHESAGDYRSEDGFSPNLKIENGQVFCSTCNEKRDPDTIADIPINYDEMKRGMVTKKDLQGENE